MRTVKNWKKWKNWDAPGNWHNPPLYLTFRDAGGIHDVKIGAGYNDQIRVFREGEATYVLTLNFSLYYVGLEAFDGDDLVGEVFLQNDWEIEESLGSKDALDKLSDITIAKRLAEYTY